MTATTISTANQERSNWAAYTVAAWAFPFAALSFYWALGGTAVADLVSPQARQMVEDGVPWFIIILWVTGLMKAGIGLLGLALVRPWGRRFPRWLLLTASWLVGILMFLYGVIQLSLSVPVYTGAVVAPGAPDPDLLRWHVFLWQPYWALGGILLIIAAAVYRRRSRNRRPGGRSRHLVNVESPR